MQHLYFSLILPHDLKNCLVHNRYQIQSVVIQTIPVIACVQNTKFVKIIFELHSLNEDCNKRSCCWGLLVQISPPQPHDSGLHDYITQHGLGFCKLLKGEPWRLLIPSIRSTLAGGLPMLQYFMYHLLVLSHQANHQSQSKWPELGASGKVGQSQQQERHLKSTGQRDNFLSPWRDPNNILNDCYRQLELIYQGENQAWFYDFAHFVHWVLPLWTSVSS